MARDRVTVRPRLFRWARTRSGKSLEDLSRSVHKDYPLWEKGEAKPTMRQLEKVSAQTHTGLAYFFLSNPPSDDLPIQDFRTPGSRPVTKPSINLLGAVLLCQSRQAWYRGHMLSMGASPLRFVGSARLETDPDDVAKQIRGQLGLDALQSRPSGSWDRFLRDLVRRIEDVGVLVMMSNKVENKRSRPLNPDEFRGFALVDEYAPVIFVNTADAKAAQLFTLAHELAHVWLGKTAVSNFIPQKAGYRPEEVWCNKVAAEVLVPMERLREAMGGSAARLDADKASRKASALAKRFRVSNLVVIRRLRDAGFISREVFSRLYERSRRAHIASKKGGKFRYSVYTIPMQASYRFTKELVHDTVQGNTLYRDAIYLLSCKKAKKIIELEEKLN